MKTAAGRAAEAIDLELQSTFHPTFEARKKAHAAIISREYQELEQAFEEILSYFPTRETVEELMPDVGLGFRPAICGRDHGLGPLPKDSDLVRWISALSKVRGQE